MPSLTRVNGSGTQVGTLYSPNCFAYLITVKIANGTAVDLQAQDSYGGNAQVDGVIEMIVKEVNPKAWFAPADSTGKIHVICDMNIDDATELQTRIRNMSPINGVVVTGTTVVAASSITVA
jgi:hypothetical protein